MWYYVLLNSLSLCSETPLFHHRIDMKILAYDKYLLLETLKLRTCFLCIPKIRFLQSQAGVIHRCIAQNIYTFNNVSEFYEFHPQKKIFNLILNNKSLIETRTNIGPNIPCGTREIKNK